MASILTSFNIAKENLMILVYFVEDDYIHKKESIMKWLVLMKKLPLN